MSDERRARLEACADYIRKIGRAANARAVARSHGFTAPASVWRKAERVVARDRLRERKA